MTNLNRCLVCGGFDLRTFLDLGDQPPANAYHRPGEKAPDLARLAAQVCLDCYHQQLTVALDPFKLFSKYLYVSGTTDTFKAHCRQLAAEAMTAVSDQVRSGFTAVDVGGNDGTLAATLRSFRAGGRYVVVDPASNLAGRARDQGVEVVTGFWPAAAGEFENDSVDLITAVNVLAHGSDPVGFLSAVRRVLSPNGLAVVEVHYAAGIALGMEFDTVYHEHVSYFTAGSFNRLAERSGLHVHRVVETPTHGGSIRFHLRRRPVESVESLESVLAYEAKAGLRTRGTYDGLQGRVDQVGREFKALLAERVAAGRPVVAYGASAKGTVMLHHFGVERGTVRLAADDNPLKQGLVVPGKGIPIVAASALKDEPEGLVIIATAWNFLPEVRRRIRSVRGAGRGDEFLLYVPAAKVVPL